jgi:hypothetical protein
MLTAICPGTSTKPSQSTNTPNQSLPNILLTKRPQSNMVHGFRGWRLTPHNPFPQSRSNASKTLLVPSFTMHEQLTLHFLLHSVPFQHAKTTTQGQWQMRVINSSTMSLHIPMQAFGTRFATWYYQYTRKRHTFPNPAVKVEQPVISTSPMALTKTSTMALFSPCLPSSNMSCHQPLKLNLPCSTMAASLQPHFETH